MSTIKDVAKAAGVSVSTVSNILNNKISVSEKLYQRVIQAMEELNYRPNLLAMNLRNNRINFIGILVNDLFGHCHQIIEGIYRVIRQHKCQPLLRIADNPSEEIAEINALIRLNVGGIIVISSNLNAELVQCYRDSKLPIVFADLYPADNEHNAVCFDNYHLVRNLTEHLLKQGKGVGLIAGDRFLGSEDDSIRGYLNAMRNAQEAPLLYQTKLNKERAFAGLVEFASNLEARPDYIIVTSEQIAETMFEIFGLINLHTIQLVALSGNSWYKHYDDKIIRVHRDAILCGIEAANLVFENIASSAAFDSRQISIGYFGEIPSLFRQETPAQAGRQTSKALRLLLLKSGVSDAVEKLSENFANTSGIEVSITTATQQELEQLILENARSRSSQFDIIMADVHWFQRLKSEHVFHKLNDALRVDEILPRYIHDVHNYILSEAEGDDVYALPILVGYQMLLYRGDLFEDALLKKKYYLEFGLELRPPQSWSEFNLIAKFFTREVSPESPVRYGTCLSGNKPEGIMAEFLPRQWVYHGKIFDRDGLALNSSANLKAARNLCESYQYSFRDCLHFLEDEQIKEFLKGDIAMISTYNVHLQDKLDYTQNNIRFSKLPGSSSLIGGWMLGINAHSKQIEESVRFLEWEMSDRISVQSSLLGQVSPFRNVFFDNELLTIYPWMDTINKQSIISRRKEFSSVYLQNDINISQLENAIADNIWNALSGRLSPEEALKDVQERFDGVYRKKGKRMQGNPGSSGGERSGALGE